MIAGPEFLGIHPQLQIHLTASQIESALRHIGNRLAQNDLHLILDGKRQQEPADACRRGSLRCV